MKKTLIIALSIAWQHAAGQTEHNATQNMALLDNWNPAYSTMHENANAVIAYRNAWSGVSGAPQTGMVQLLKPWSGGKFGTSLLAKTEQAGYLKRTSFAIDGAYALITPMNKISFGLRLGVESLTSTLSDVALVNPDDLNFRYSYQNIMLPNAGFGFAMHHNRQWGFGFSVPRLLQSQVEQNPRQVNVKPTFDLVQMHACIHAYKKHQLNEQIELQASLFGRTVGRRLPYAQAAIVGTWKKMIGAGISYQYNQSASCMVMLHWKEYLTLSYSYDFPIAQAAQTLGAAHEVVVGTQIKRRGAVIKNAVEE
ncbi:MAG: PorP/SprF family type IX secretion system membrane protein [Flavobacteriales bacterium]